MRRTVAGLILRLGEGVEGLPRQAADRLGVPPGRLRGWSVLRRSVDARGHGPPRLVYTLGVELAEGEPPADLPGVGSWPRRATVLRPPPTQLSARPLVVGSGPAGLFAALRLCAYGLKPIVLERGSALDERVREVARYWRRGELDPESNVQFGEGGAGTFSDGKLTYRGKDSRKVWVFERLVAAGANPDILFEAKPHLGTDRLRAILRQLRSDLLGQGVEVRFRTRVERLLVEGGRAAGVETSAGVFRGSPVFLAPGHSARALWGRLSAQGIALEAKPFAVGVRVELPQEAVDRCQYRRWAGTAGLPRAEFAVKTRVADGRDVFSFCMCPGGVVIPAGSEPGGLVVNGMSASGRTGRWANAALVVAVGPSDVGAEPLAGCSFQGELEARAARLGGEGRVPAQGVRDFLAGRPGRALPRSSCPWPLTESSLEDCLPPFVTRALREALPVLARQLPPLLDALLLGIETRTSSPVRIVRGDELASPGMGDLYPIGEGAGYAGGIVSAAVDGVRAADAWVSRCGGGAHEEEPA